MKSEMVYIIRDENGNYVSPREARKGWYFVTYSGKASGFKFYSNVDTAKRQMEKIKKLGEGNFTIDFTDISMVPEGEIIPVYR